MLTAKRAFGLNARSAPLLPKVPELAPLYDWGAAPRVGQVIMIAGRPGSQKSGFALFWVRQMGLPTLYMSGDMTPFEATSRLVGMETRLELEEIEERIDGAGLGSHEAALDDVQISFSFGSPITYHAIEAELEGWVELHNAYPPVIVIDNLMDIEGCEAEYAMQTEAMQILTELARTTGSTVMVLHHASDKTDKVSGMPPARREIKNGLAEKPQLTLGVAFDPDLSELRVAVLKQRSGRADPSGLDHIRLRAYPEVTRFAPLYSGTKIN